MKITFNLILSSVLIAFINISAVTITFDTDGGSTIPDMVLPSVESSYELPEPPTKEGFTFEGWYYQRDSESSEMAIFDENFDFTLLGEINGEILLNVVAKWIEADRNVVGLPEQILPNEVYYTSLFIELDDEMIALSDALPQTGQPTLGLYYVFGAVLIGFGVVIKHRL